MGGNFVMRCTLARLHESARAVDATPLGKTRCCYSLSVDLATITVCLEHSMGVQYDALMTWIAT